MAEQELLNEQYLEKMHLVNAVTSSDAGVAFLQWLHRLTGFGKPSMSMEDAARRDVWLTIRPYIEVGKLSEIEHHDLRAHQNSLKQMMDALNKEESDV